MLPYELLLTNNNGVFSCISNVCTHRGHLLCDKMKDSKLLKCRYHGRTFNLSGELNSAPGFEGAKKFPSERDNLKSIDIIEWNDFFYASLGHGIDISGVLSDIESRMKNFPFHKLTYSSDLSSTYEINAHWAIYCENYLEGFHVPFVHKGLSKDIDNQSYTTEILNDGVLQYANKKNSNNKDFYAHYYWLFPNMMFNFYDWGLSINIVEPIAKDRTRVRFLSFPINSSQSLSKSISDLIRVEYEDQAVVESVCKGMRSRYYERGRYSPNYEKGVHYFHQLLSRYF